MEFLLLIFGVWVLFDLHAVYLNSKQTATNTFEILKLLKRERGEDV